MDAGSRQPEGTHGISQHMRPGLTHRRRFGPHPRPPTGGLDAILAVRLTAPNCASRPMQAEIRVGPSVQLRRHDNESLLSGMLLILRVVLPDRTLYFLLQQSVGPKLRKVCDPGLALVRRTVYYFCFWLPTKPVIGVHVS